MKSKARPAIPPEPALTVPYGGACSKAKEPKPLRVSSRHRLPPEDFQPFTSRDRAVLDGLRQRSSVREDCARPCSYPFALCRRATTRGAVIAQASECGGSAL